MCGRFQTRGSTGLRARINNLDLVDGPISFAPKLVFQNEFWNILLFDHDGRSDDQGWRFNLLGNARRGVRTLVAAWPWWSVEGAE